MTNPLNPKRETKTKGIAKKRIVKINNKRCMPNFKEN
jgi:hypothetical protein